MNEQTKKNKPLQETFLNELRKNKTKVSVFMVNGIKLDGHITHLQTTRENIRKITATNNEASKVCFIGTWAGCCLNLCGLPTGFQILSK